MAGLLVNCLQKDVADLTQETLVRASKARFARVDDYGRIVTVLQLAVDERLDAADNHARFALWIRVVGSVLRRRGAAQVASTVETLGSELEPLVLFQRKDVAEVRESVWRTSYADELTRISHQLARIVHDHAHYFEVVQGRRPMQYETFDVRVSQLTPERWSVEAGGALEVVSVSSPFPGRPGSLRTAHLDTIVEHGQALFRSIFQMSVLDAYARHREKAAQRACGLRLQLHLGRARSLSAVPWELLHDGKQFLALGRETSVTRCVTDLAGPGTFSPVTPIRVLLTVSAPRSLPWLDAERERELLEAALGPLVILGLVQIDVAPDGSMNTLRRMFRAAADGGCPYHVWHFIGHGSFDEATGRSSLAMAAAGDEPYYAGGREFGELFDDHPELHLAFLNSCDAARGDAGTPMSSVASALVETGIPAAVAMQYPISDVTATLFADELYGALADGVALEEAVTEARRGVFFSPNPVEWFTPVLLVRSGRGASVGFRDSRRTQK